MLASVYSSSLEGVSGRLIEIECDTSNSLPSVVIVGLGSKSVDEAKERIRSAFTQSGLTMPRKRITINLAPADIAKDGASFDLPMALAILLRSEQIPKKCLMDSTAVGELGLAGSIRSIRGVIGHVICAKTEGFKHIFVPYLNAKQASLVPGIEVIGVRNLRELYLHLLGEIELGATQPIKIKADDEDFIDLVEIKNQQYAKRALIIAAAGGHNILLSGPPGTGKTMLSRALVGILPKLDPSQILEVTQLHSLARRSNKIISTPPFRHPHHTASHTAVLGGGRPPLPGEVSLAHHGVLFLDELPEFNRLTLEGLRQPLEDQNITIARADKTVTYPANLMFVATQNPCPCGHYGDEKIECTCLPAQRLNYEKKLSGPLKDRIDLTLTVGRVEAKSIIEGSTGKSESKPAKKLVNKNPSSTAKPPTREAKLKP